MSESACVVEIYYHVSVPYSLTQRHDVRPSGPFILVRMRQWIVALGIKLLAGIKLVSNSNVEILVIVPCKQKVAKRITLNITQYYSALKMLKN